jgi:hypothetical protein
LRERVLRNLASQAAKDPAFLRKARTDLMGALASHGYRPNVLEPGPAKTSCARPLG